MKDSNKKNCVTILNKKQRNIISGGGHVCTCCTPLDSEVIVDTYGEDVILCQKKCCVELKGYISWTHMRWVDDNYWRMKGNCADGSIERDDDI